MTEREYRFHFRVRRQVLRVFAQWWQLACRSRPSILAQRTKSCGVSAVQEGSRG